MFIRLLICRNNFKVERFNFEIIWENRVTFIIWEGVVFLLNLKILFEVELLSFFNCLGLYWFLQQVFKLSRLYSLSKKIICLKNERLLGVKYYLSCFSFFKSNSNSFNLLGFFFAKFSFSPGSVAKLYN